MCQSLDLFKVYRKLSYAQSFLALHTLILHNGSCASVLSNRIFILAVLPAFREQNYITEADGDMLHREARVLALWRIEESARTEDDFQKVIEWWDKLDENRERRERDHEIGRSTVPLEWGADELYLSDRPSYNMVLRTLLLAGNFLDLIFDSPETIHELVTDAESIGQSDRNIRGIRETALKRIRKLYGGILAYRKENSLPMTLDEKYFLENGVRKKKGI